MPKRKSKSPKSNTHSPYDRTRWNRSAQAASISPLSPKEHRQEFDRNLDEMFPEGRENLFGSNHEENQEQQHLDNGDDGEGELNGSDDEGEGGGDESDSSSGDEGEGGGDGGDLNSGDDGEGELNGSGDEGEGGEEESYSISGDTFEGGEEESDSSSDDDEVMVYPAPIIRPAPEIRRSSGRNRRRRRNPPALPYHPSSLTPRDRTIGPNDGIIARPREVRINSLQDDSVYSMNLNRNYVDVQVLRVITPLANQNAQVYGVRRRNNVNEVTFSRLFMCRVHTTSTLNENSRLIYLMEARNCNDTMFEFIWNSRDDGSFKIGAYIRILAPLPIENNMRGDIALMKTQQPVMFMNQPSLVPSAPINYQLGANNSLAFAMNNVELFLNRLVALQTSCSGFLCDKQRVTDWNGVRGCGCYHMTNYTSNIALQHSIHFNTPGGRVTHNDFSSHSFSLFYLSDKIPGNVNVSALRMTRAFWAMEDSCNRIVAYVNKNGGWTVIGWYKRGVINDRSLLELGDQRNVANNDNVNLEVGAGELSFHVCQLMPTNRDFFTPGTKLYNGLRRRQYDVTLIPQN